MKGFLKGAARSGVTAYLKKTLLAVLLGAVFLFLLLCLLAFLLDRWMLSASVIFPAAMLLLILTGFAVGFTDAKLWREKGLLAGAVAGMLLFLLLFHILCHLLFQFLSRIMKMPFYGTFADTEPFCDCLLRQSVNVKRNQNLPLQIV